MTLNLCKERNTQAVNRLRRLLILPTLLPAAILTGCGRSPTFNILGSFFPSWLLCLFSGVIFAVIAERIFTRFALDKEILWPVVVYPCLALLFSCVVWLIFFS
jgi:YtcA family